MEMIDNLIILATAGWGNRLYLRDETDMILCL
jgi:hypothetical protein